MRIQSNDHGVYMECTEHIHYETESGASIDVYLVDTGSGWVWGTDIRLQWSGGGGRPSIHDNPLPSRLDAIDAATERLLAAVNGPKFHELSENELLQLQEVRDWCKAQKQMDLFQ